MAKDIYISSGLRDGLMITGAMDSLLEGGRLRLFAGTIPATADAAIGSATAIVELTADGNTLESDESNGLTFEASLSDGALIKKSSETWSGTASNGSALSVSFWRWEKYGDDGSSSSTSAIRVQGTAGTIAGNYDLVLANAVLTDSVVFPLPSFLLRIPRFRLEA